MRASYRDSFSTLHGDHKETREWLCGALALFVGTPLVFAVAHLLFNVTAGAAPPEPTELLCRYAGVFNATVREQYRVGNLRRLSASIGDADSVHAVDVDITYLRYRVECVAPHNATPLAHIYTLGAFGTTEEDAARLAAAASEAHTRYDIGAPPFRRWLLHDDTVVDAPVGMSIATWLARWLYYGFLLALLGPLAYLVVCMATMHCTLPRWLIFCAVKCRSYQQQQQQQQQSCI